MSSLLALHNNNQNIVNPSDVNNNTVRLIERGIVKMKHAVFISKRRIKQSNFKSCSSFKYQRTTANNKRKQLFFLHACVCLFQRLIATLRGLRKHVQADNSTCIYTFCEHVNSLIVEYDQLERTCSSSSGITSGLLLLRPDVINKLMEIAHVKLFYRVRRPTRS
ncbi:hypothetical protein ABK040_011471 [Willaertia magna]